MNNIMTSIFSVFNSISDWLLTVLADFSVVFYTSENGLTFLGTLAVAGLGFSVVFLVLGIIQRFLHFRG